MSRKAVRDIGKRKTPDIQKRQPAFTQGDALLCAGSYPPGRAI